MDNMQFGILHVDMCCIWLELITCSVEYDMLIYAVSHFNRHA